LILLALGILAALLRVPNRMKLAASTAALLGLFLLIGVTATNLMPPDNNYARVSPSSGFWLLVFANSLMLADVLTRLRLGPWIRIGILLAVCAVLVLLLYSGSWSDLSILREYA